jgi:hypothetical protein
MSAETASTLPGFQVGEPCREPAEFDGGEDLIFGLQTLVGADDMQCASVIGDPASGKSSLLHVLAKLPLPAEVLPEGCGQTHVLSMDLGHETTAEPEGFFALLLEALGRLIGVPGLTEPYSDFDRGLEVLRDRNERLVLLLDNFQAATLNPRFPVSLFEYLRSRLSTLPNLGCVVSSHMNLRDLCSSVELAGSPFFNIFSTRRLQPLSQAEAVGLLARRLPGSLSEDERVLARIVATTGPHPLALQIAGAGWAKVDGDRSRLDETLETTRLQTVDFHRRVYRVLSPKQQRMLEAAARGASLPREEIDLEFLERGWLEDNAGRLRFRSEHFERFVRERLGISPRRSWFRRLLGR